MSVSPEIDGFEMLAIANATHLLEYNPRYFDEPEKFKPSRWYGVPAESEVFTAFSVGEFSLQDPFGKRQCSFKMKQVLEHAWVGSLARPNLSPS